MSVRCLCVGNTIVDANKKEIIMKKLYVLLTLGVLVCGLAACGKGNEDATPSTEQSVETQESSVETENTDETESEEATGETENTEEMVDVATPQWSEEMATLRQSVADALGDQYWPDMMLDAEMLEGFFGLTPDMYDDYMAEMPMIGTNVDTLLIVKAKDDKVEAVEEALNAYREMKVADTMQYPMNLGKIQASRIQRFGNYVCFVQLGGPNLADENMSEEESLTKCQEQNELALEIIGNNVPQE